MDIISFRDFSFRYDGQKKPTLKNINLNIRQGEKVLIAGPSGSGKSTLAHCINGLIPFSYKGDIKGQLLINGMEPYKKSIHEISEHVGTVLQDQDGQFVGLSVGEDTAFIFENNKVPEKAMLEGVQRALSSVDMLDFIEETPHNLSGGQKQRVSLAGLLTSETDILLFDEPLANLDPASGSRALTIIDEIYKKTNKTIIIIEHRIEDVLAYQVDRVIVMDDGEIIGDGSADSVLSSDILSRHGLREPLYIEALKKAGISIDEGDRPSDIDVCKKYAEQIREWYNRDTSVPLKMTEDVILKMNDIWYRYFDDAPYTIKGINFEINKGEVLAVLGNNGAGKSTLLKIISGIAKINKGSIYYKNENITSWSIRKRAHIIGYVMQNPNHMITQHMIFDEVAFGPRNFGVPENEIKDKVYHALKVCGLFPYRNWPVSALSYGQKKRLTIASILVMNPEIIILDEPTAGQDYRNYREFMDFIRQIKNQGTSVVIITHDMHLAMEYADRAVVLSGGEIIAQDSVYMVLSDKPVIERANLKETSLTSMAYICGIEDPDAFIYHFINEMEWNS